jgi:hypothetical protein
MRGEFSVGFFSYQLVCELAAPEINTGHLKKNSGCMAEKMDQRTRSRSLARFGRNPQQ